MCFIICLIIKVIMERATLISLGSFIFLILLFFYLLISMDCIEPLHYGITYNRFTKRIGSVVYDNGRYILNPFKSFMIYPANLVTIEFSDSVKATSGPLQTRTGEGLGLTLSVSFQYKIIKEDIPKLYNLANVNYYSTFVRISRDVLLKVGGMYNATNYWTDRLKISEVMRLEMNNELKKAYARCISLQLLKIDLPKTYEDSIVLTQVEIQKTNMRKFEQIAELIRQNSSVIISEADQKIRIVSATAQAEAYRLNQFATATAMNNTINAETDVYKNAIDVLGFTPEELTRYVFLNSITEQKKARILFDLQNTLMSFTGPPKIPVNNN